MTTTTICTARATTPSLAPMRATRNATTSVARRGVVAVRRASSIRGGTTKKISISAFAPRQPPSSARAAAASNSNSHSSSTAPDDADDDAEPSQYVGEGPMTEEEAMEHDILERIRSGELQPEDFGLTEEDVAPPRSPLAGGGGAFLRVVTFSLAVWLHATAPLGGRWGVVQGGPGDATTTFVSAALLGTPLQWFGVAFVVAAVASSALCSYLSKQESYQPVREEGPRGHLTGAKSTTPTLGGLAFVPAGCVTAMAFTTFADPVVVATCLTTLGFLSIGAFDDVQKLLSKNNARGLSPYAKLGLQSAVATSFVAWLSSGVAAPPPSTAVALGPWMGAWSVVDLGSLFWALSAFAMVSESNAVNITDGLDGLAAATAAIALVGTGIALVASGQSELAAFSISLGGAAAGFLVVNRHPADMFMGDAGSLALGGALGAVAAAAGGAATLPLVVTTAVFIAETVSVIAQVSWFKWTKKKTGQGERLLRMAPLHHHLELGGWGELKVVATLTACAGACAVLGVGVAGVL
jgi:phospho-N-acetylmuramoyl-pentapeptide-transferase|eukprot:30863-Pelagococcus_subviridis.AAC.4